MEVLLTHEGHLAASLGLPALSPGSPVPQGLPRTPWSQADGDEGHRLQVFKGLPVVRLRVRWAGTPVLLRVAGTCLGSHKGLGLASGRGGSRAPSGHGRGWMLAGQVL